MEARGGTRRIPVPQRPGWVRQEASTALLECSAQVCTHTRVQTHARMHARALKHPHTHQIQLWTGLSTLHGPRGQACPVIRGPRGPASMQRSSGSISLICSQAHLSCWMEHLSRTPDSLRLSAPHPLRGEAASGSPGPAALSGGSSRHPSQGRHQRGRARPCHAPWWPGLCAPEVQGSRGAAVGIW